MLFTERGVLVGLVHFSMPTMILILAAALSHIDPAYERAAASLGARRRACSAASRCRCRCRASCRAALIVFAWTLSAFPTPELLGGGKVKMIANVVRDLALDSFNWPGAAAFAMLALALTLALLAAAGWRLGRARAGMIVRAVVVALVAFMTLPTVVVIAVSFNPTAILSFPPAGFSLRWYATR